MKIVNNSDPEVLELRSGVSGCIVLIGLAFVAGGVIAIGFGLGRIPIEAYLEPQLLTIITIAGAIGIALGLIFIGGRSGKIFDRRQQALITWSGLFVPMRRKLQRLDNFSKVVLIKEVRRGNKSTTVVFLVSLKADVGSELPVDLCTTYIEARLLAEAIAKALYRPMVDSSSGIEVVREPEHLDESLRERLRRLGERIELGSLPHEMRSTTQITSSEVTIKIPGIENKIRVIMNAAIIIFMSSIALIFFGGRLFTGSLDDFAVDLPLLAFSILAVGVPMSIMLFKINGFGRSVTVNANRGTLTIIEGNKRTEIPGDELEELSIAGKDIHQLFVQQPDGSLVVDSQHLANTNVSNMNSSGRPQAIPPAIAGIVQNFSVLVPDRLSILARSDRTSISFGAGLESEELAYLYSAILKAISD